MRFHVLIVPVALSLVACGGELPGVPEPDGCESVGDRKRGAGDAAGGLVVRHPG